MKEGDDLRVLDYNGYNGHDVFNEFRFSALGEPVFIERRDPEHPLDGLRSKPAAAPLGSLPPGAESPWEPAA